MQPLQNGIQYKPGSKVFRYFLITRITPIVIIFVILGIGLSFVEKALMSPSMISHSLPFQASEIMSIGLPVLIILGIIIILFVCVSAWIEYASVKFMLDEFAFHIEHGIISKSEVAIPYRQIQNVNHAQSWNEKTWGIARVIVETAGTDDIHGSQSGGVLPILDADLAVALEQELLSRSSGK